MGGHKKFTQWVQEKTPKPLCNLSSTATLPTRSTKSPSGTTTKEDRVCLSPLLPHPPASVKPSAAFLQQTTNTPATSKPDDVGSSPSQTAVSVKPAVTGPPQTTSSTKEEQISQLLLRVAALEKENALLKDSVQVLEEDRNQWQRFSEQIETLGAQAINEHAEQLEQVQQTQKLASYLDVYVKAIDFSCMRSLELSDLNVFSAKVLGEGCNGSTSKVTLKKTNDFRVPLQVIECGVALKMLYNLQIVPGGGGKTDHQRDWFGREYSSLVQNPHWGVANILSFFRSFTQANLIPPETPKCIVHSETGQPLNNSPHNHCNCISVYDRTTFISEELGSETIDSVLSSKSLAAKPPVPHLQQQPQPLWFVGKDLTISSAFQLLTTVDFLNNERGVFHLDIKTDNILLLARKPLFSPGQFTVLCDFGASMSVDPTGDTPGKLVLGPREGLDGNLMNRAPETLRPFSITPNESWWDVSKTDVWAVGCVLWNMCFGIPLFKSQEETTSKAVTVPPSLSSDCPFFSKLLTHLLDRDTARRPPAWLASAFVGAHMFLDLAPPAFISSGSQQQKTECIEKQLDALRRATCSQVDDLAREQAKPPLFVPNAVSSSSRAMRPTTSSIKQTHIPVIPVRLFLQMVFLNSITIPNLLDAFSLFCD
ncbi:hypothetical protein Pelo_1888 [Pelomyxa schiedti]|nr:hypothetical protein Pelo_1888 [Pelomyxa schiedti]